MSECAADAIATIDPLFSVGAGAPDQVSACFFTERNVNHTREVYRKQGGLKALQRIIASVSPGLERWIGSVGLQTPEAAKIVRKSVELGCFWASLCFWKEPEWSEEEYVARLRCPALWTAASWVMDMLNDELGVATEAVIQIHQDGWDGVAFEPLPSAAPHVNECLRAMSHGVWTVRQWMDQYWWTGSHYGQLEEAVRGYLNTQYQRTTFSTFDEFLEYRSKSAGGAPIHLMMAILKRDVVCGANPSSENNNNSTNSDNDNDSNNNTNSPKSECTTVTCTDLEDNTTTTTTNKTNNHDLSSSVNCEGRVVWRSRSEAGATVGMMIPMGLLDLSTVQTTAINDILDHERDAAEGSPNLVNFMHSELARQREGAEESSAKGKDNKDDDDDDDNNNTADDGNGNGDGDDRPSRACGSSSCSSSLLSEALASALRFHQRVTRELRRDVGLNPRGGLEKQAAQVAYGCYLMEVLHPRYSELASQIAALYPPAPLTGDLVTTTTTTTTTTDNELPAALPPSTTRSQVASNKSGSGEDASALVTIRRKRVRDEAAEEEKSECVDEQNGGAKRPRLTQPAMGV